MTGLEKILYRLIAIGLPAGLLFNVISGGYIWSNNVLIQKLGLFSWTIFIFIYLFIRRKKPLPYAFLVWFFLFAFCTFFLSLVFAQRIELGFWRTANWLGLIVLFFLALDAQSGLIKKEKIIYSVMWVSGVVLVLSAMEISNAYSTYWNEAGNFPTLPPQPYRLVSILGHPNALMALVNISAPVAVILLIERRKNPLIFSVIIAWLTLYIFILPFTSSRGGLLGLAGWSFVLIIFWLFHKKPWNQMWQYPAGRRYFTLLMVVVGAVVLFVLCMWVWATFINSRIGGANPWSGREEMWSSALQLFRTSPWVGVGPGNLGLEVFRTSENIPPLYWPSHFHSLILNTLAETGILGFLSGFVFLTSLVGFMIHRLKKSELSEQIWLVASLASLAGLLFHSLVDDLSHWMAIMAPLVLILAIGIDNEREKTTNHHGSILWLTLPGTAMSAFAGILIWASLPYCNSLEQSQVSWRNLGDQAEISQARMPGLTYFQEQAVLAYSFDWYETGLEDSLQRANQHLLQIIAREPENSLFRANLAMNQFYLSEIDSAFDSIRSSIALAPQEPSYWLIEGFILEMQGENEEAADSYTQVLNLAPEWSTHPFWELNPERQTILLGWQENNLLTSPRITFWQASIQACDEGELELAQIALANSRWMREDAVGIAVAEWHIAMYEGSLVQAELAAWHVVEEDSRLILDSANSFSTTYSLWIHHLKGLAVDLVPGYLQLEADNGQFEIMTWLHSQLVLMGECNEAARVWENYQTLLHGGVLTGFETVPDCNSIVNGEIP